MSGEPDNKVITGPGSDRWPGSPQKDVDKPADPVANKPESKTNGTSRDERHLNILRLKVISAVQMAVLRFSEEDIRRMVEQAFSNVRNRNDYS